MTPFFQALEQADKTATLAINSVHCPASDWVWTVFSDKEIWYVLYLAVVVFLFFRLGWKKALAVTLSCILCVVACDQLGNVCKDFFARLRPCCDSEMTARGLYMLEGAGNLYGFYSAHAANCMGFAVCSWLGMRNNGGKYRAYGICVTIWASLVGLSRIFVGKHVLGDVLVGFAVGALIGFILAKLCSLAIDKLKL